MTRLQALLENGCTVGEAEIIALKLDALGSDEERAEWIARHLKPFLAAIRAIELLREISEQERIANAAMADLAAMVRAQNERVDTDPYCDEVMALIRNTNTRAWYDENLYGKRKPNQERATREAIEAREAKHRREALEVEAEAALAEAVKLIGGAK
jgi:uncharacterized membrane protein YgaE (UPF0421/DUF939 family)